MITWIIVTAAIVFGLAFAAAWLFRPDLREWIERPKHGFERNVRRYDQSFDNPDDGSDRRPSL
jgi:hypothetical protein